MSDAKLKRHLRRKHCVETGSRVLRQIKSGAFDDGVMRGFRLMIKDQTCPLCGEGGFTVVAMHARLMHGIDRREFRDLFGLTYTESICSPKYSKHKSEQMAGVNPQAKRQPSTKNRVYSVAGAAIAQANLKPWPENATREEMAERGRRGGSRGRGREPHNKITECGVSRRTYLRGCRCEKCVSVNSQYWQEVNRRRKETAAQNNDRAPE